MKYVTMALALLSTPVIAQDCRDKLAETMYSEARGKPVEYVVAIGHNVKNRAKRTKTTICQAANGYTQKKLPSDMKAAFLVLASGVLSGQIPDNTKGADSYELGRPSYKGQTTRSISGGTFYVMKEVPWVRR
jgi:hypothetical protein